jgi:hypothetical protein
MSRALCVVVCFLCGCEPSVATLATSETDEVRGAVAQAETLFGNTVPALSVANDPSPVEVGVKFQASVAGEVRAIRFYRGVGNPSGYRVHLWAAGSGQLLGSGNVVEGQCTAPCWQEVTLDRPVATTANTLYIASYFVSGGNYSFTSGFFSQPKTSGHLTAIGGTGEQGGNGVYVYGGGLPIYTYQSANYWVDVQFVASATTPPPPTSSTIFGNALPNLIAANDPNPVELGVKFRSSIPGRIAAVRFFRGSETGAGYRASIWSAGGQLLGSGNVVEGQCAVPCWQEVQLWPQVAIAANTTYVASYFASRGNYAFQAQGLASGFTVGNLTALADGFEGGNSVYAYGSQTTFPTASWNASNYFVDVRFVTP